MPAPHSSCGINYARRWILKPKRLLLFLGSIYIIASLANLSIQKKLFLSSPLPSSHLDHEIIVQPPRKEGFTAMSDAGAVPTNRRTTISIPNNTAQHNNIKTSVRSKAHWCFWRPHMGRPMNILRNEFGYNNEVNPEAGEEWDIIFGGYQNCGSRRNSRNFDWKMETGLNKYLNEQGWDKLQPHQVWFPCMGCAHSYCNKKELCLLIKKIDPTYCFSLPGDRDRLLKAMEVDSQEGFDDGGSRTRQFWVVKEDYADKHLHVGHGVRFIKSTTELPNEQDQSSGAYLVQPLVRHKTAGAGEFHRRRHELRMYVSVTSTTPLRAYAYSVVGKFANAQIDDANPLAPCSVDTHGVLQRKLGCHDNPKYSAYRSFDIFSENIGLTESEKELFLARTNQLVGKVLMHAQPKIQNHTVNEGITRSGAACFSFLRVDFAVTDTLEPYFYEINEFPFANEHGFLGIPVQENAYRELFRMMGLDRPPLIASERSNYEMANLGNWTPLVIDDVPHKFL
eukprot:CAMPEP_0183763398 /NCGR_PEP_ID=MMETSP0739-20130205/9676_1 /TAXON_ID=385413 /ORGANISM="Thalassiosira miniscula, Strain CCMP1093" /LENGTH=507 /DNA_ID=CAMNT_0026001815 /DNA_START=126 /DNA_END=1649 /DNA_ORIENTATION=+